MDKKVKLIVVCGLPGSGKSFFSEKLKESTKFSYLSSDLVRMSLFENRSYSEKENQRVYEHMLSETRKNLMGGESIVLDATFIYSYWRNKFQMLAKELEVPFFLIQITASEVDLKNRLSKKRAFTEADYAVYLKLKKSFNPIEIDHIVLNTSLLSIKEMLSESMKYIKGN